MYHSLIFWDGNSFYTDLEAENLGDYSLTGTPKGINTWRDWHLIPTEKPSIALPPYESNVTDIYGRSGSFDITDTIYDGKITYGDRTGSIQFYIDHKKENWIEVRSKIVRALHGKRIKMVLEDDLEYYFEGHFSLTAITPGASYSQLTLSYQLNPYRKKIIYNNPNWGQIYWDPFAFETDYDLTADPNFDTTQLTTSEGVL